MPKHPPAHLSQEDLDLPSTETGVPNDSPTGPRTYSADEKRALKAAIDDIEQEQLQLEQQLEELKIRKSDAVFELQQAMGGKPFRDAAGVQWTFATKKNTHFLRKMAGAVEEL
jgi:hypothetical protein